jgi:Peptidase propeptide and YPEB domain
MKNRFTKIALGLAALTAFALGGAALARGGGDPVPPGTLDDGGALLPKAGVTVEQAVIAAQSAASGKIGEVDLENEGSKLVFNVDVGSSDVKVDAADGSVVGAERDDPAGGDESESGAEGVDEDGPGGHADEPDNPNADHQNEGGE